jgi:purine-binding chemotaxis protein CheW
LFVYFSITDKFLEFIMKILLIDDDEVSLKRLASFLKMDRHCCSAFTAPQQAIEAYRQNDYDVVITDMIMPNMTGLEVLQRIRSLNPDAKVIIVTGQMDVGIIVAALNKRAYAYLFKPLKIQELMTTLKVIDRENRDTGDAERGGVRPAMEFGGLKRAFEEVQDLPKAQQRNYKGGEAAQMDSEKEERMEMIRDFVTEGRELLDDAESQIIDMEKMALSSGKVDEDVLNGIFRFFHSIKGTASFLDLQAIISVTHEAETLLDIFRKSKAVITPYHVDLLCRTTDFVRSILDVVDERQSDVDFKQDASYLVEDLKHVIEAISGRDGLTRQTNVGMREMTLSGQVDLICRQAVDGTNARAAPSGMSPLSMEPAHELSGICERMALPTEESQIVEETAPVEVPFASSLADGLGQLQAEERISSSGSETNCLEERLDVQPKNEIEQELVHGVMPVSEIKVDPAIQLRAGQQSVEVEQLIDKTNLDANLSDVDGGEGEDTQQDKYLTFIINKEDFGIEIRYVTEIIGMQDITEVPDMPPYVKGVINLRGKVIPVMDVRLRFGAEERPYDDRTCIIVINIKEQPVGLIVDRVLDVLDIPKEEIEPPPHMHKGTSNRFVQGLGKVGDYVKVLLNAKRLLRDEDEIA